MRTISIDELLGYLNCTDLRAVRTWCEKNSVFINKQGKHEFVYESNFFEAYHLPFINYLKTKYGNEWEVNYFHYRDGNIPALHQINNLSSERIPVYKKYKSEENEFVTKLLQYERKKKNAA